MWAVIVVAAVAECSTKCKTTNSYWSSELCQGPGIATPTSRTECYKIMRESKAVTIKFEDPGHADIPANPKPVCVHWAKTYIGGPNSAAFYPGGGTNTFDAQPGEITFFCKCTPCAPASNTTKIMRPGYTALGIGLGLVSGGGAIAVGTMSG